ncbi:MAG: hypothetical protein INR71_01915 [Terriglobus roseus]|nr:hypothetical protein [Terriglobus roseus]
MRPSRARPMPPTSEWVVEPAKGQLTGREGRRVAAWQPGGGGVSGLGTASRSGDAGSDGRIQRTVVRQLEL